MKTGRIFATLAILLAISCMKASAEENWRPIFNGKDLNGWKMAGPGGFKVEDGNLVTYGGMGLLLFEKEKFGNCEIKVVFQRADEKANSGIYIRIKDKTDDPWFAVHNGYEVQIAGPESKDHGGGTLYSFVERKAEVNLGPGKWVTYIIRLDGDRTVVTVDGVETVNYKEGDPVLAKRSNNDPQRGRRVDSGYIGLQNHDDHSKVLFKEVGVRPLPKK